MRVQTFHFSGEPVTHPDEDALAWQGNRFAVFDGITLAHQNPYPDPSPAAKAAQLGCQTVLRQPIDVREPAASLRQLATAANQAIGQLNQSLGITEETVDYLTVQYAATVGAFGFIEQNVLHCAQLTDCEVIVLDKDGTIKFRLESLLGPIGKYMETVRSKEHFGAGTPGEHQYVRKNVINNPDLEFKGKPIRVGVFTGQKIAEQFLKVGQCQLAPDDTVLFFSDGMTPFVDNPEFQEYLVASDLKDLEQHHRRFSDVMAERSLIVVRPGL